MRPLTLINTLEYYDVPQILVAADATGTNYLCTLYKNDAEDGFLCSLLQFFCSHKVLLRICFLKQDISMIHPT